MAGWGALKAGFSALGKADWGGIGKSAWGAIGEGFSKRAITGAVVGGIGGAAKGGLVDYGEQGQPLFSSLASNAIKGAAIGAVGYGVGGGLLGKGGKAFRSEFSKAFNGFRSTLGGGTAAAAAAPVEAKAVSTPISTAGGGTPSTASTTAATKSKYAQNMQTVRDMAKARQESAGRRATGQKLREMFRNKRNGGSPGQKMRRALTDSRVNPLKSELQRNLGNDFNAVAGSAGTGAHLNVGRGLKRGLSFDRGPSRWQKMKNFFGGWTSRVGYRM